MVGLSAGAPEARDGRYYASNHGALTPLSHSEYLAALAAQARLFTIGAAMFGAVATAMVVSLRRAAEQSSPT